MANVRATDPYTNFGANVIYAQGTSSLWWMLDHFQAGKLYLAVASGVTATGVFEQSYPSSYPNYIGFDPVVNPSGAWWVSSKSSTGFVITFATTPNADVAVHVGNWFACL
jgi:hypothetical protein